MITSILSIYLIYGQYGVNWQFLACYEFKLMGHISKPIRLQVQPSICQGSEAVAAGSPYRYPLWLARALNSAFFDVKWDYESDRAIARIADFYIKIAVFIINLCCCAPFCKYT